MANKLWIKAKICGILLHRGEIHYRELFAQLAPSCHKDAIEVLAGMYSEKHIWSNCGMMKWNHDLEKVAPLDISYLTSLCQMIANYAGVKWDPHEHVISELSQNSFNE